MDEYIMLTYGHVYISLNMILFVSLSSGLWLSLYDCYQNFSALFNSLAPAMTPTGSLCRWHPLRLSTALSVCVCVCAYVCLYGCTCPGKNV